MRRYQRFILFAAAGVAMLEALGFADSTLQAAPVAPCAMQLRVELTPDVPNPRDAGFVSSLLGNHPEYRLTLEPEDLENASLIALALEGPGPETACGEVVNSMRRDARVVSVAVLRDAASAALPVSTAPPIAGARGGNTARPRGTMRSDPDGDWVLQPLNGVSYAQVSRDRYECDLWAADQTGFDPTTDDGVPPPDATTGKADYLRAEAACFEARGYRMK